MQRRLLILILILLVTGFFAYEMTKLKIYTSFGDLLPQKHPYIQVHNRIRNLFGGANQVLIMVQVRKGDIFNTDTLEKVKWITRELETIPGVDPYKIRSIASSRMKDFRYSAGSLAITTLMFPNVPKNEKEMADLKDKIYSNPRYYGPFVCYDSKKTLMLVDFFEESIDYSVVFNALNKIREHTEDANTIINIAGEPMHLGVIKSYTSKVLGVLTLTVLAMIAALFFFYRSIRAVVITFGSAAISAVWGIGFMAFMGYTLDPLIIVMPFLIALMTARHSMQLMSRYMEEFEITRNIKLSAQNIIEEMFLPGFIGILADALGVSVVAIATIPILERIAISCTVWLVGTIILSLIFTPIILSYMPTTERFTRLVQRRSKRKVAPGETAAYRTRFLSMLGTWIPKRGKWYILIVTVVISVVGFFYAQKIMIGDFFPGSSILWPFDRYNKDAFRIAFSMPLLNPLYVIVEGNQGKSITPGTTLRAMDKFQRYIAKHERVMFVNSVVSSLPNFLMSSFEDNPQWNHLPKEDRILSFLCRQMTYQGAPGTWDLFIDQKDQHANIIIYCRDKMPKTVESIMNYIKDYIQKTPDPPGIKFVLAGGPVGVQAAVRDVIADAQIWNLIIALGGVFLFCAINFKSVMAGLILTIPLAISNILTFALMGAYSIGLTVNTYPVSSIGIGLGVDYGIYFVGRLLEERKKGAGLNEALFTTMTTNGISILQIATILTIGLVMWIFSPMKFQAEMGVLLAILLLLNMLGALLLVPAMICALKPRFVKRS